uniref:Zn(2)-C6 fungal-type domain-containing protein n=1 Tax=Bionectria ochroleuca TaxID=29856 RepID=A0A8H7K903_BIOOC
MATLRIRFAPYQNKQLSRPEIQEISPGLQTKRARSHLGCRECKRRRVKCDETFPVCLRCQRRGSICLSNAPQQQWQVEVPWLKPTQNCRSSLFTSLHDSSINNLPYIDPRLLLMWLDKTSHIMGPNTAENPLSYPIFQYIHQSPALVHIIQSLSAGHEHFFEASKIHLSLEQRSLAMLSLAKQIETGETPSTLQFLTCWLLGISATFIDKDVFDIGKEHLFAARSMVDSLVSNLAAAPTPLEKYIIGVYVYWDLTCCTLLDTEEQLPFIQSTVAIQHYISQVSVESHPIIGGHIQLFLLLANLGRHCKAVTETGCNNPTLEASFETSLKNWPISDTDTMWEKTVGAFVKHGLVMLYRLCDYPCNIDTDEHTPDAEEETEVSHLRIDEIAIEAIRTLLEIPVTSTFICLQPIPLLSAGSELSKDESDLRLQVVARLEAIYSSNRLPCSLWTIQLLVELWELHDAGLDLSWLDLMNIKKWRLRVG